MPRTRRIAQNILSNWLALAIATVAGFFLSPFVVHRLGNLVYGVWVLIGSVVAYMSLLDLGLRGAVTRYVSKGVAQEDHEEAGQAVSGALWIRLWISVTVICGGLVLATAFNRIFDIPIALQRDARFAIIITATSVAISLWSGVFGGVLIALHRYDLTSSVSILQTCLRAGGVVFLLRSGHGILALAIWDLCTSLTANAAIITICFRIYPKLKIAFRSPSRTTLAKLWTYSFYVFLINVALQVTYYTDNVVVGAFLSPAAVTFYAIGGVLIAYARQIVTAMTTTFTPLASTYEAQGSYQKLRELLIHGTRAALIISLPIAAGLFFRGHTFIRLWMGEQYTQLSGTVMQILLLSMVLSSANETCGGIVYGMEKHKRLAFWAIGEAAANLILSVILVRRMGIYGVAWGTSIPSVIVQLLLWPRYISALVGVRVRTYLWETWCRTALAIIPFALGCLIAEKFWPVTNLLMFFVQMSILLPLVPAALFLVFRRELVSQARRWITRVRAPRQVLDGCKSSSVTVG
jgi:O-antigen/teichoic acid export membrane protein